jgi:hypothetical protein
MKALVGRTEPEQAYTSGKIVRPSTITHHPPGVVAP